MKKITTPTILALAILLMASACFAEDEEVKKSGFGLAPGLTTSANVPLGKVIELPDFFEVHNYGKKKRSLILKVTRPQDAGITGWEKGFEPLIDVSWCKLEKEEIELEPSSVLKVKAVINIPKTTEFYNRKFMVTVTCEAKPENNKPSAGLNLRMVSRWMLETESNSEVEPSGGHSIGFAPSIVRFAGKPGEILNASVAIRNQTKVPFSPKPLEMKTVEPDAEKYDRYFGTGRIQLINESWISPIQIAEMAAGEIKKINIAVKIPNSASPGKIYEELIFFKNNEKYDFLRVRTAVNDGK